MARVLRYDSEPGTLAKPKRLRGGALRVDGHFTKPGVFPYQDEGGRTVMEYRPSAEVLAEASIESWKGVPLTEGHPPDLVTDETWSTHAIGNLGDDVRADQGKLAAGHVIHRKDAVQKVVNRALSEESGGYWAEIDETPGVTAGDPFVPDGIRYDRVQRAIEGNHVALLPAGHARLGRDMAMRLDAAGHQVAPITTAPAAQEKAMKFKIDGITIDLGALGALEESAREVLGKALGERETLREQNGKLHAERDELRGRCDATSQKLAEAEGKLAAQATAAECAALEARAKDVLGAEYSRGDKAPDAIRADIRDGMVKAIVAVDPEAKLDGLSDDYVRGLYAGISRGPAPSHESLGQVRADAVEVQTAPVAGRMTTGEALRRAQKLLADETDKLALRRQG